MTKRGKMRSILRAFLMTHHFNGEFFRLKIYLMLNLLKFYPIWRRLLQFSNEALEQRHEIERRFHLSSRAIDSLVAVIDASPFAAPGKQIQLKNNMLTVYHRQLQPILYQCINPYGTITIWYTVNNRAPFCFAVKFV